MYKILIFLMVLNISIYADETDNFTYSKVELEDISYIINMKFNFYIQKAIDDTNALNRGENPRYLYKSIKKYITDKTGKNSIIRDLYEDKEIDIIHISKGESIYKNWTLREGLSLGRKNTFIGSIINFNNTQIGIDKLEHLFRTGRILYIFLDRGWEFENVLKLSYFMERWLLGGNRIGASILSYGDLTANFNGIRLWNDFLGKYPDPLDRNLGPYIVFQDNLWILAKEIDLRNYIDESFDESINNSYFSHKKSRDKFWKNIEEAKNIGLVDKVGFEENPEILRKLIKKYGVYAIYILNFELE